MSQTIRSVQLAARAAFRDSWTRRYGGASGFSSLPDDIAKAASGARFPARRVDGGTTSSSLASTSEAAAQMAPGGERTLAQAQREGAAIATVWMFPWERRQMEGGKLTTWEKVYWGAFVAGMSLLAYNNLPRFWKTKEPPKVDEDKEARKLERTRLILAGQSVLDGEEFDGLEPEAIQEYVSKATAGASAADPFEGMSPEEINEYIAKHGNPV
ncbi:hypothetical protein ACKKBF_B04085 [Auxenochlorella protothecoides x Auxenochlorella symbiontica]